MVSPKSRFLLPRFIKEDGVFLTASQPAVFSVPFQPLYFAYDQIMAISDKKHKDKLLVQHLDLLVQVIKELFEKVAKEVV